MFELERSLRFWGEGLRFRLIERGTTRKGNHWARLSFRALRPIWSLDVVLVEDKDFRPPRPMLHDRGATCLALLSTDLRVDVPGVSVESDGVKPSMFDIVVAQKRLRIALLRGPDGEIVEFIQP